MQYAELIRSVELGAAERIEEIRRRADREIESIRRDAEEKGAAIRQEHREQAVRAVASERERQISGTRKDIRMEILKAKADLLDRAFRGAEAALASVRERGTYPAIFRNLLLEAVREMDEETFQIHVNGRDADLCRSILQDLNMNCEILPDLHSAGGLIARSRDGRLVVENTLESRLARAREALRSEIFPLLYGD
ncbi:MAG: V-type ATP synthase subunit E family protein [Methanomicrobiales archaeon]|nr:V-type ATP synthase subunit E family protein [Methanomicrobiales archaeon]MDI6876681.1 V-type ATP synthase subunit E family protein [Methanomicrobiales archaeon]